jgi:PAS domain S-box-containing protein
VNAPAIHGNGGEAASAGFRASSERQREELAAQRAAALNLAEDAEAARQKAEKAQAQFRALLEAAPDAMVVADRRGGIVLANGRTRRLFGYATEELLGSPVSLLMPDRSWNWGDFAKGRFDPDPALEPRAAFEVSARRKDGSEFPADVSLSPMESEDGILIIAAIRDVTERRNAAGQIRDSLLEKEALLKEIHHRVKNNLQIISSLLRLQADRIRNPRDLAMLKESEDRVNSMALIHEMLYQSRDLAHVHFGDYVRNLASELFQTYDTGQGKIRLDLRMDAVELDINWAIPLGLILNEVVSNSLKYAFPEAAAGVLSISLASTDGELVLEVGDDGVGLPSDFGERRTSSLGLQIVESLSRQMRGRFEFGANEGGRGTRFRLAIRV